MSCCNKQLSILCSSKPNPDSDSHWYTPKYADDFGIKNIPDEIECLVTKEAKILSLKTDEDYALLSTVPETRDLSNAVVTSIVGSITDVSGLKIIK